MTELDEVFFSSSFEPRAAKFELRAAKFEPRAAKFELRVAKFEPRAGKFEPRVAKFRLRVAKFEPRATKFELLVAKFKPQVAKFEPPAVVWSMFGLSIYAFNCSTANALLCRGTRPLPRALKQCFPSIFTSQRMSFFRPHLINSAAQHWGVGWGRNG